MALAAHMQDLLESAKLSESFHVFGDEGYDTDDKFFKIAPDVFEKLSESLRPLGWRKKFVRGFDKARLKYLQDLRKDANADCDKLMSGREIAILADEYDEAQQFQDRINDRSQQGQRKCPRVGHSLKALRTSKDNGWSCNGIEDDGGCKSGITALNQTGGMNRFQCEKCNYDLCQKCFVNKSVPEQRLSMLQAQKQYAITMQDFDEAKRLHEQIKAVSKV